MALTAPLLWLDGTITRAAEATIPLMGHAPQRGSLVFDVGSFHPARGGVALFRAREHVARFMRSARIVELAVPFDEEALLRAAMQVVEACGRSEGLVRWSVLYASAESDLLPRDPPRASPWPRSSTRIRPRSTCYRSAPSTTHARRRPTC